MHRIISTVGAVSRLVVISYDSVDPFVLWVYLHRLSKGGFSWVCVCVFFHLYLCCDNPSSPCYTIEVLGSMCDVRLQQYTVPCTYIPQAGSIFSVLYWPQSPDWRHEELETDLRTRIVCTVPQCFIVVGREGDCRVVCFM